MTLLNLEGISSSMLVGVALFTVSTVSNIYLLYFQNKSRRCKSLPSKQCTTSAPGKALVAGGYLVLDSSIGVTIASTSRFYSTIKCLETNDFSKQIRKEDEILMLGSSSHSVVHPINYLCIIVESPQFHSRFKYYLDIQSSFDIFPASDERNDFIEKCLSMFFSFAQVHYTSSIFKEMCQEIIKNGLYLGIKLRADNDFYSQINHLQSINKPLLSSSLAELPKFMPCPLDPATNKPIVIKTGMGSSAALCTALMSSLLQFFFLIDLPSSASFKSRSNAYGFTERLERDKMILNNLSQLAHAVAQGKLGSGFDVSAAVYGSQLYRRFAAEPFAAVMEPRVSPEALHSAVVSGSKWTQQVMTLALPPMLQLVMGDVCGGSSSTSMARVVLGWRAARPEEADDLWSRLASANLLISQSLISLATKLRTTTDKAMLQRLEAKVDAGIDWESELGTFEVESEDEIDLILAEMVSLRSLFQHARRLLKRMGECAGVDIEPDAQTELADATARLPGVLCAGVPGAGGVDAIYALVLSPLARQRVEVLWSTWKSSRSDSGSDSASVVATVVCPLLLSADSSDSPQGTRTEDNMTW